MTVRKTPPLWAHFFASPSEPELMNRLAGHPGELTRYRVDALVPVIGPPAAPVPLATGHALARVEDNLSWDSALRGERGPLYLGRTQHLVYTAAHQRQELETRSRPELPAGEGTRAVIIPIRKRAEWWRLAQDERQGSFHAGPGAHGAHTAIGLEYVDRIFRRLYHARHLGVTVDYDFVTYFELQVGQEEVFRSLLAALRDPGRNPEWAHVEWEHEIWLTKLG